jgi:hypothetical protein
VWPVNPHPGGFAYIREVVDSSVNKQRKQRGVHPDVGLISAPSVFTKLSSMIQTAVPPTPAATTLTAVAVYPARLLASMAVRLNFRAGALDRIKQRTGKHSV